MCIQRRGKSVLDQGVEQRVNYCECVRVPTCSPSLRGGGGPEAHPPVVSRLNGAHKLATFLLVALLPPRWCRAPPVIKHITQATTAEKMKSIKRQRLRRPRATLLVKFLNEQNRQVQIQAQLAELSYRAFNNKVKQS